MAIKISFCQVTKIFLRKQRRNEFRIVIIYLLKRNLHHRSFEPDLSDLVSYDYNHYASWEF